MRTSPARMRGEIGRRRGSFIVSPRRPFTHSTLEGPGLFGERRPGAGERMVFFGRCSGSSERHRPWRPPGMAGGESMSTEIIMPQMGESIAEGTITKWLKKVGDPVKRDEPIFEISTDKVDAAIPTPVA